jgi:hypothetical protein
MYPLFSRLGAVVWDVAPCDLVDIDQRFRGAYCLHNQGDRPDGTTSQTAIFLLTCAFHFQSSFILPLSEEIPVVVVFAFQVL